MYDKGKEGQKCPGCLTYLSMCTCTEACHKCKFYQKRACTNKESGNFKLTMALSDYCTKYDKRWPKSSIGQLSMDTY